MALAVLRASGCLVKLSSTCGQASFLSALVAEISIHRKSVLSLSFLYGCLVR